MVRVSWEGVTWPVRVSALLTCCPLGVSAERRWEGQASAEDQ